MPLHRLPLIALLLTLLASTACVDEKCGRNRNNYRYKLQANVQLLPIQSTYAVGDTMSLRISFPEEILDLNHNTIERIVDLNIRSGWWLEDITDITNSNLDVTNAITIIPEGTTIGSFEVDVFGNSTYAKGEMDRLLDNSYAINYRFILDSTGYYRFSIGRFFEDEEPADNPIELADECGNGRFEIAYRIEGHPVENSLLLCEADSTVPNCTRGLSDQEFLDMWGEDFLDGGLYIFKVE